MAEVTTEEVKGVLKRIKAGKATGPDEIPVEAGKSLGQIRMDWLTDLFNAVLASRKMPRDWRAGTIASVYRNKRDLQDCSKYRGDKAHFSHPEDLGVCDTRKIKEDCDNDCGWTVWLYAKLKDSLALCQAEVAQMQFLH